MDWTFIKQAYKTPVLLRQGTIHFGKGIHKSQAEIWLYAKVGTRYVAFDILTRAEQSLQLALGSLSGSIKRNGGSIGAGGSVFYSNGMMEMPLRIDGLPNDADGTIPERIQDAAKAARIQLGR